LAEHAEVIIGHARKWKYGKEVSAFLRRLMNLEDEWRESAFPKECSEANSK
jgi:hypothetical protein